MSCLGTCSGYADLPAPDHLLHYRIDMADRLIIQSLFSEECVLRSLAPKDGIRDVIPQDIVGIELLLQSSKLLHIEPELGFASGTRSVARRYRDPGRT